MPFIFKMKTFLDKRIVLKMQALIRCCFSISGVEHPRSNTFPQLIHGNLLFSGWTSYNASIRNTVPTPNTIGFLQPVNESPTEIPAMYTVMKRSQYFAHLLELLEVDCVYDQACYAKASQILWASPDEFGNVVNRLGAFHTVPVFISCIFQIYGDADLIDVITESGIVASGLLQVW